MQALTLSADTTKRDARGYPVRVRMNEDIAPNARGVDARAYHHGSKASTPPTTPPATPPAMLVPAIHAPLTMAAVLAHRNARPPANAWQNAPLLERIAARTVPTADRADCVQEQRMALWRARGTTDPAMVFTVANRAAIDYARKHCRVSARGVVRETVPLADADGITVDPMAEVDARLDGMDTIQALIGATDLPTLDIQIMVWRHVDGEGYDTIAARLGISTGAARVRLHRTLARLRDAAGVAA